MGEAIKMPAFARAAEVRAGSYDEATNTVEVIWTTGAPVRRRSWRDGTYYDEVLVVDNGAVRLDRLNAGAPLLDTHDSWSLDSVIGAVVPGTAEIRGGKGYAKVRLSSAQQDADRVQKIRDGIVRNISVGYLIHRVEKTEKGEGEVAEWRVVDWEPMEISAVPVPADPGAQVRSGGNPDNGPHSLCVIETRSVAQPEAAAAETLEAEMHETETAAGEERGTTTEENKTVSKQTRDEAAENEQRAAQEAASREAAERAAREAAENAVRAERERSTAIRALAEKFGVREFGDQHVSEGTDLTKFRELLIDHLAARETDQPQTRSVYGANAHVGEVNPEKRAAAIENALLHRVDPRANALTEDGRDFRGMSLIELARDSLEARGVSTRGMTKMEVAARALQFRDVGGLHSTSDFPIILSNVANRTLRAAYEAAPQTFRPLVRETTVADFKPVTRAQLGEAPSLDKVNEHGEFTRGTVGEAGESYRILTYGKIVGITRQVIVNDDLEAFTRLPRMFGTQAAQLESDLVWAEILGNPAMGDGKNLFSADHNNLGTAAAIGVDGVSAGRTAMSLQTGLDKKTVLNLSPSYIIVPVALQTKVEQFLGQIYATKTADAVPNSMKALVPISEPRLDNGIPRARIAGDAKAWYLAASPGLIDVIELAYLEGQQGVYTETRMGFDIDGVEVKVRLDVGAKTIDWRGLWKNPGV